MFPELGLRGSAKGRSRQTTGPAPCSARVRVPCSGTYTEQTEQGERHAALGGASGPLVRQVVRLRGTMTGVARTAPGYELPPRRRVWLDGHRARWKRRCRLGALRCRPGALRWDELPTPDRTLLCCLQRVLQAHFPDGAGGADFDGPLGVVGEPDRIDPRGGALSVSLPVSLHATPRLSQRSCRVPSTRTARV